MNMNYKTVSKAQIINAVSDQKWTEAMTSAAVAKRTNKRQLCLDMIMSADLGVTKEELQTVTGWDSHNLHSTFRKSFCEKNNVVYDYKTKRFYSLYI